MVGLGQHVLSLAGLPSIHRPDQLLGMDPAKGGHLAAISHREDVGGIVIEGAGLGQWHLGVISLRAVKKRSVSTTPDGMDRREARLASCPSSR